MANLLPAHYSEHEKNLETIVEAVFDRIIGSLWSGRLHDPMTCDARYLFVLGKHYGVEYWWQNISEEEHRTLIASFPMIRRRRGTLWAVKQALYVIDPNGYVIEGCFQNIHNGSVLRDGTIQRGYSSTWAQFVIITSMAMNNMQSVQLRKLIESVTPVRSELIRIDYSKTKNIRNGVLIRDGAYNRGAA